MATSLLHKSIVLCVADQFEDATVLYPTLYWSGLGADIRIVPFTPKDAENSPVTGRYGLTLPMPGIPAGNRYKLSDLKSLSVEETDALIIPGGYGADLLRSDARLLDFLAELSDRDRVIGAIGHGIQVLISADALRKTEILPGHRVTCAPSLSTDVIHARGRYENEPALVDGRLVTGRGADDLPEFCDGVALAFEQRPRNRRR